MADYVFDGIDISTADTDTLLYTCPTDEQVALEVWATNREDVAKTIRVCHTKGGTPANAYYRAYDMELVGKSDGPVNIGKFYLSEGDKLYVRANDTDVNFTCEGFSISEATTS